MNYYTNKQRGFTLLEILVAIAILSIISVIIGRSLQIALTSKTHIDRANAKIEQLQLAMTLLQQDLQQTINRPVLNHKGETEAAMAFFARPFVQLSFTRSGFANPGAMDQRSTLQRVAYCFKAGALQRLSWPALDCAHSTTANTRILLTDLKNVSWRFLASNNSFSLAWPANKQILPKAVELQLTFSTGGNLTRLIMLNANDGIKNVASPSKLAAKPMDLKQA